MPARARTALSLEWMFQQASLTDAIAAHYGEVRLEVRSQRETRGVPPPHCGLLDGVGPLIERRIRLHVAARGEWRPIVCAVSWIDRGSLSPAAREALAGGKRMLGEVLAAEPGLRIVEAGIERGTDSELAKELGAPTDAELLLRWRYWSRESGRAAVLLLECARVTLPG